MDNISICIICRNEAKDIQQCLQSLSPLQSEIIVADTGSTDETMAIAHRFTDNLFSFKWCSDFSAARNFAASKATNDWILVVDSDEYLTKADIILLEMSIAAHPDEVGMIERSSYSMRQGSEQTIHEHVARLYNRKLYHYAGRIHEDIAPIDKKIVPMTDNNLNYFEIPLTFLHAGYQTENVRRIKAERELRMLQDSMKSDTPTPYTYYQIGKCYITMNNPALAAHYFDLGISKNTDPSNSYVQDMVESYGYCLLDLKQYDKALSLEALYDTFSGHADFVYLMGLIYMNNNRFQDAIAQFKKASGMPSASVEGVNSYSAWYNIGVICECIGKHDEAVSYYRKCGSFKPSMERLSAIT